MRIISWNVNGIRAIAGKGFADILLSSGADVFCVQETKANIDQLSPEITDIGPYRSHFYSAEKKGYSGTAVYINSETMPEPISIQDGFGVDEFDHEGRSICVEFDTFVLYNIYFPNGGRGDDFVKFKLRFYDCFLDQVDSWKARGKEVVCCGDVNTAHREIDLSNPKANSKISGFLPEEREYMDIFISRGLCDAFRHFYPDKTECYTWWSYKTKARERNVGWRIDYFFVTNEFMDKVTSCEHLTDIMGSDHCPIELNLDV